MKIADEHVVRSGRWMVHRRRNDPSLRLQMHGPIRPMADENNLWRRMWDWMR